MFQFAGLPPAPYVFRCGYRRITSGEFPHSEIPGSKDGQLLPRAYRSRPRPSSALGAKASTVCPCSLDREEHRKFAAMEFSRCARALPARQSRQHCRKNAPERNGLSKLSSVRPTCVEVDVISRRTRIRTAKPSHHRRVATEVIAPVSL